MCARQWITSSARGPVCVSGDPITRAEGPGVIHCFADSAKEGCSAVDGRKCHRFSRPIQGDSWTLSDLEQSPQTPPSQHSGNDPMPQLKKSESSEYFSSMGEGEEEVGGEEVEVGAEEMGDEKALTKRDIHTLNEQRRRDIIKHGYAKLADLVPTCKPGASGVKLSRAVLLQKALDYIQFLQSQSRRHEDQLLKLRREVEALRIMKENYEQIARTHCSMASSDAPQVPDHIKFMVFQGVADQLFQSFNSSISVTSFDTLSSCIISWLEEYCKPQVGI
ncbi:Max-like protein X [Geodia barretti]|uniref:Max-like protein X n=1 Tax=Geodia barretti TaxID=519541 RepID=A0AA35S9E1_GEOBA|nr:Max-like protein X [Geodia barretti]